MKLGEKIYLYRTRFGMTQSDLAERLEVSRQSVSKWELDEAVPDLDKLVKMSELFQISLDALVKQEGIAASTVHAYTEPPAKPKPPHYTAGIVLFCTSIIVFVMGLFFNYLIISLALTAPLLLCAIYCLCMRRHAGLACLWTIYTAVYIHLALGTGVSSVFSVLLAFIRGFGNNNTRYLLIVIPLAIVELALVAYTVWHFRNHCIKIGKKLIILTAIGVILIVALGYIPALFLGGGLQNPSTIENYFISAMILSRVRFAIFVTLLTVYIPIIYKKIKEKRA